MFSKLTRDYPVEIKPIEKLVPDEMFLNWLHQMRNPTSTDSASQHTVKPDPPIADHPSTRETA